MQGFDKSCIHLVIAQGMLPWQSIKVVKSAFIIDQSLLSRCHSETAWNVGTLMGSLEAHQI